MHPDGSLRVLALATLPSTRYLPRMFNPDSIAGVVENAIALLILVAIVVAL